MKHFAVIGSVILASFFMACDKDNDSDKRSVYIGEYQMGTGPAKYYFDAFGQYWESTGTDTAVLSISKNNHPDSSDYIYLERLEISDERTDNGKGVSSFRFEKTGRERVVARVTDSSFVIPSQIPFSGFGMSIKSDGSKIKDKTLTLTYSTFYRGFHKEATVVLKKK